MRIVELGRMGFLERIGTVDPLRSLENGKATLVLKEGLMILELCPSLLTKGLVHSIPHVASTFLSLPKENSVPEKIGRRTSIERTLNLDAITDLAFEPTMCIKSSSIRVTSVAWGPPGLVQANGRILAVVTNTGTVTMWEIRDTPVEIFNVSNHFYDHIQSVNEMKQPTTSENYSRNVLINSASLQTTAITWYGKVNKHDFLFSTLFVTAQNNGRIYFWSVSSKRCYNTDIAVKIIHEYQTEFIGINLIEWLHVDESQSILFICNALGQIDAIKLDMKNDGAVTCTKTNSIWRDADKILVKEILCSRHDFKYIRLIIIKGMFFIVVTLDLDCNVLNTSFENLGNFYITAVKCISDREYIVCTYSGALFKLDILHESFNSVSIKCMKIDCNINYSKWLPCGMWVPKNNNIFIFVMTPRFTFDKKMGKHFIKLIICHNEDTDLIKLLQENNSNKLTDYWDCLELLRVVQKQYSERFNKELITYSNEMTLYQIKLCMWFQILYEKRKLESVPPKLNHELMLVIIFEHVIKSLELYVHKSVEELNPFQLTTISLYINFLEKYDGPIKRPFPSELIASVSAVCKDVLPQDIPKCEWCNEEINSMFCSKKHPRQWCCVTLQEIKTMDCLVCKTCGNLAHPELLIENPLCTFCDSYFERHYCILPVENMYT